MVDNCSAMNKVSIEMSKHHLVAYLQPWGCGCLLNLTQPVLQCSTFRLTDRLFRVLN